MTARTQAPRKPVLGKPVKEEGTSPAEMLQRSGAEMLRIVEVGMAKAAKGFGSGAKIAKDSTIATVSDRRCQVTTASAAGGAAMLGVAGATTGCAVGGTTGACLGLLPAVFTFGLSIPLFTVFGGASGLMMGGAVGGVAGLTGGGAAGYAAYTKRARIGSSLATGWAWSLAMVGKTRQRVAVKFAEAWDSATTFLGWSRAKTWELAADKHVQVAVGSAAGGAAVLGTGGGAVGLLAGSSVGAAVGVVPALFTFGLSIPFCAVVGGGFGLVTGVAAGSATGFSLGGLAGYGFYSRKEKISSMADGSLTYAKQRASSVRARLNGSGATGETQS